MTRCWKDWEEVEAGEIFDRLPVGKRYDQWSVLQQGLVPVLDQSLDGFFGYHNDEPGIVASPESPIVTFSNHRCYVRLITRPFSVIQNVFPLKAREGIDPYFMFHALRGSVPVTEYKGHWSDFIGMKIRVPPLEQQHIIAHILGTLDDKIELNRRMNQTLEEMARAIFKSWFVDFDPVRAKAAGRQPSGMDAETAKLFPSEFVESELGDIPKGWRVGSVGDLVEIHDAKRVPLSSREREQRHGKYPYYGATSVMDYVDDYLFDGVFVLIGEDGSVVNDTGYPFTQYVWGQFWVNNHAHVLTGSAGVSQEHLFLLLGQTNVASFVTGAVQAKLSQGNLRRIPAVVPPVSVSKRFDDYIFDSFARYRSNVNEISALVEIRDMLLPRLLSGHFSQEISERISGAQ